MKTIKFFLIISLLSISFVSFSQDTTYCVNELSTQTYVVEPSDSTNNFNWSSNNQSIVFSDTTSTTTEIDWAGMPVGNYILTFTEESNLLPECSSSVSFTVSIVNAPSIEPIAPMNVCESSTELNVNASANGASPFTYDWGQSTNNSGTEILDLNFVNGNGSGYDGTDIDSNLGLQDTLIVTDSNGCSSETVFNITIVNTPNPGAITNP